MAKLNREKKVLHISKDEKFIDSAYRWSEKNRPSLSKFWIISDTKNLKYIKETPCEIYSTKELLFKACRRKAENYDAVILHNLDLKKIIFVLLCSKKIKFIWVGLGTDYYKYIYKSREQTLLPLTRIIYKQNYNEVREKIKQIFYQSFIIKKAINKITYFAPVVEYEYNLIKNNNKWFKPKFVDFNYGTGKIKNNESLTKNYNLGDSILIGNSATYENNHLDFFEKIKDYKLVENEIICPLSYGRNEYRDIILESGEKYFSNKFNGITEFLKLEDYKAMIADCSIVVMNHIRQQAVGNIMIMISMGAKIYLRKENYLFNFFQRSGYKVFAIEDIKDEKDFLRKLTKEEVEHNKNTMRDLYTIDKFEKKISSFYSTIVE